MHDLDLDLDLVDADLLQRGEVDAPVDVFLALIGAHRQHPFEGTHDRHRVGCMRLRPAPGRDQLAQHDHQFGPQRRNRDFLGWESEVREHVAG